MIREKDIINGTETKEKVVIVGIRLPCQQLWRVDESLDELSQLANTAGAVVLYRVIQNREKKDAAFLIGKGKAEDIGELCRQYNIDAVIFDEDMTPAQSRNLERLLDVKVIDRTELILDIFARRAKSNEGKLQVELAQLKYLLPKLVGKGLLLSRLGGGIGTRGPGETKLEIDRRRIRAKITKIERALKTVKKTRYLHRKSRKSNLIPTIALVGYTNAGKSTLFNKLTDADVFVEDKLFATLDTTVRRLSLPNHKDVLLADTVGFIRKLPHNLVASFMATLEELKEADLILHVIDGSNLSRDEQIYAVRKILHDLDLINKPVIHIYNKIDLLNEKRCLAIKKENEEDRVFVSALNGHGISDLIEKIDFLLSICYKRVMLAIPYNEGKILGTIYKKGKIIRKEYHEEMVIIEAEIDSILAKSLRLQRFSTKEKAL
ncbi:MAG: GTPase HflX [Nitrospirota bacterium]